jgi:lysophospholipase L1-like esterase
VPFVILGEALAEKYKITYIDLYSKMLDGNELSKNYTKDGIHLNGEASGYGKMLLHRSWIRQAVSNRRSIKG